MNKETFCAYPFSTVFLGADGGIKPCCSARGTLGNINDEDIDKILGNKISRNLRETIVNGTWHSYCSQCKELEELGARTERTGVLDQFDDFKDATADIFILKKIDLRWSNTCNLSCNYCYPFFSSKWANILGEQINENKKDAEEKIFMFLEKHKNTIEVINLLGGEPLLQKQNKKLIKMFPDSNYYILSNLAVDITKNDIAQSLMKNTNAKWGISFETIGKKFEYVRHGGNWNRFTENLKLLSNDHSRQINAHPLYCTYTALNLVEFYDFVLGSKIFDGIYWCAIQNIHGLNITNMDKKFKERAIKEIERVSQLFKGAAGVDHLLQIKQNLEDTIDVIPTIDGKKHFIDWSEELETKYLSDKNYSFKDLWPDLF